MYCDVVIPDAGKRIYTYKCEDTVKEGDLVTVPFGKGTARGLVITVKETKDVDFNLKEVEDKIFPEFSLDDWRLRLFRFLVEDYAAFPTEVAPLFFPPGILSRSKTECRWVKMEDIPEYLSEKEKEVLLFLKERYPKWVKRNTMAKYFGNISPIISDLRKRGLIVCRQSMNTSKPKPFKSSIDTMKPKQINVLTKDQMEIYNDLIISIEKNHHKTFLLFGITGSGKTAIYYKLFEYILNRNKSGIFLVPEIALTVQTLTYFLEKYKNKVFVYHSGLSKSEKNWIAQKCATSQSVVIIGPRSSLFLPFKNLSLIVIDEEHDFSYKEEERMPMYDTKKVAEFIGQTLNIPVLLGSGTPDVVSLFHAINGKYKFHILTERFRDYQVPEIQIVDMKNSGSGSIFSMQLINEVSKSLINKKGVILFINRRGYTPVVQCKDCGRIINCDMCSVPLVVHRRERTLKCHICGHREKIPEACPYCGSPHLNFGGYGTERIEEEIKKFFPDANIAIFDKDTIQRSGMKEKLFRDFVHGKIDILIGTQMLSIGFDFPDVETVGIINADIGLGFPDYRAEEKVAQTLFQVAGRLRKKGKVIVQTRQPEHPIFTYLKKHDYKDFLLYELNNRKQYRYPPYVNIIQTISRSKDEKIAKEAIFKITDEIKQRYDSNDSIEILGPSQSVYKKIRGEHRWQLVIKITDTPMKSVLKTLTDLRKLFVSKYLKVTVNINPYSML